VNALVDTINQKLRQKTASPNLRYNNLAFYDIILDRQKIKRFNAIGNAIKKRKVVEENPSFGKFRIQAVSGEYDGAMDLHNESGKQISFSAAFKEYSSPIDFLDELKKISGLEKTELYKYFCKVTYQVLNKYGKNVSGGERAEFNLLKALQDARQYEMLLVDEPESSFDNLFLKDNVNAEIKDLSSELPVVVVTHNSTVGMLMHPSYVIFTKREIAHGKDEYKVFSGSPGDKEFKTADGLNVINSHNVLMDTLEAGEDAYDGKRELYKGYKTA
jgi:ABC-type glutathione transport system ATPase component